MGVALSFSCASEQKLDAQDSKPIHVTSLEFAHASEQKLEDAG